jgi:glycosyltransferase involved in cell wall biosynthesis
VIKNNMRLAMVGPFGFHPQKTMRSRALKLAQPLARRGYRVRLFMPPWHTPEEGGREWTEGEVSIRYTPIRGGTLGTFISLLKEVLAWQPDVVHAFKPKAYSGLVAWWLWTIRREKQWLVTDTDDWEGWGGWNEIGPYSYSQKRFFSWQEKWGLSHCDRLTVASRTLHSLALAHGLPKEQVIYLPNGPGISGDVTPRAEKRAELGLQSRPVVLIYSRLFEFDIARLIVILKQVRAELTDLAVLIVGTGLFDDDAESFRSQLGSADLLDAVTDVGWVEESRLPEILTSADVAIYLMDDTLVNRSKCPVKLADLLYAALPVVAEDVGQVREYVISDQTGMLHHIGETKGMAADLIRILRDPTLRNRLSAGAKNHIEANFRWEHLADIAEQAYSP